jgi:hypothetical protein
MSTKTASGLVSYCKAQLGKPYWYGTYGNRPTAEKLAEKMRQYPYPKNPSYSPERMAQFRAQIDKFDRVHDCVGLIKGYLWSESPTAAPKYNAAQDKSVGGMKSVCKTSGKIATLPETPGVLVFLGTAHVGVYIGKDQVIEARGSDFGVVQTALKGRGWDSWGLCPWVEYPKDNGTISEKLTTSENATEMKSGDCVRINDSASTYYPGGASIHKWVKGKTLRVVQTTYCGKSYQRGGTTVYLVSEINSWVAVKNLQKVKE